MSMAARVPAVTGPVAPLPATRARRPERESLFVPTRQFQRILYWSAFSAFILMPLYVDVSLWLGAGVALTVFVSWHTLAASRRIPWIPGLTTSAACVQWIVAPWLVYALGDKIPLLPMPLPARQYFGYFVPAALALTAGLYLPLVPYGRQRQVIAVGIRAPRRLGRVCDVMVAVGIVLRVFVAPTAPGSVRFLVQLLGGLSFVGALGVTLLGSRRWWIRVILVVVAEAVLNANTAQFLDLMLWSAFLAVVLIFRFHVRGTTVLLSALVGTTMMFAINGIKMGYRQTLATTDVPMDARPGMVASSFADMLGSPGRIFSAENLATNLNRFNEGWIAGRVLVWVPASEPYANGETIFTTIRSVFVPRIFDPSKVQAGGRVNVPRFTGLVLTGDTSMNMSIPGEMYANFGWSGGLLATFLFGLMLGMLFRVAVRWGRASPMWFAWVPYLLFASVSAEMGLVEVVNTLAKAFVVAALVVAFVPSWNQLLPWRLRRAALRA